MKIQSTILKGFLLGAGFAAGATALSAEGIFAGSSKVLAGSGQVMVGVGELSVGLVRSTGQVAAVPVWMLAASGQASGARLGAVGDGLKTVGDDLWRASDPEASPRPAANHRIGLPQVPQVSEHRSPGEMIRARSSQREGAL